MTDDTIAVCPECDASGITQNAKPTTDPRGPSGPFCGRYRCSDCGAYFEEPAERERKSSPARRGLAGRLERASPDVEPSQE